MTASPATVLLVPAAVAVAPLPASWLLGYGIVAGVFIGIAPAGTALGTLMPILRDAGELPTPFGTAVIGWAVHRRLGARRAGARRRRGRRPVLFSAVLLAALLVGVGSQDAVPAAVLGAAAGWLTATALSRRAVPQATGAPPDERLDTA